MCPPRNRDCLIVLWSAARAEANLAYEAWCSRPGPEAYAIYRAAEDRADAAQHGLAAAAPLEWAAEPAGGAHTPDETSQRRAVSGRQD